MSREPSSTNPSAEGEILSAWLDGEIDPAEAAELEAELARDPALKAELDSLETVVRLLRDEGPSQAPLGFHHRVMARVEQEHPQGVSWWAWLRRPLGVPLEGWAIGLAAAVALLLVLPSQPAPSPDIPLPDESSPAVLQLPTPSPSKVEGEVEDAAPAPVDATPSPRKGIDRVAQRKPSVGPAPEVIPGKVTTGEEQPGAVATVVLPPPNVVPPAAAAPQGTAAQDAQIQRFLVRSEDERVKLAVLQTCGRVGRTVGRQVPTMAASVDKVSCHLPQTKLGEFETELRKSGYTVESQPSDGLVPGTDVAVEVTIELVGGAIEAAPPAAANAAREKARMQEDEVSE